MLEVRILKIILLVYIIMCILIAGLNYGYASHASPKAAAFIAGLWHFYENWVKTLFIIAGSFLTIRIIKATDRAEMRKRNLVGFIISALIVHIIVPIILNNKELYFFTMPLPWTTTSLQLLYPKSNFYLSRFPVWGAAGISGALIFYICFSIIILAGALLFGRRLQCSTLCLFNGFASEVFEPGIPLIGKKKRLKEKGIKNFSILRWIFFSIAAFFTLWWVMFLSGIPMFGNPQIIGKIENYKYLSAELFTAMFFWMAFLGRGYCYYCPLGTLISFIGRISGQQICTNRSKCIQCGKCNLACPMAIDIKSRAEAGEAVKNIRCVGCGHCVDACPTRTLEYSTKFLKWVSKRRQRLSQNNDISKSV